MVIPVLSEFSVKLAEQFGLYTNPTEKAAAWASQVAAITSHSAFYPAFFFTFGLVLGIWLDRATKRLDARRRPSIDYWRLGEEAIWMAERIRSHMSLGGLDIADSFERIFPDLNSLEIKLRKAGFEAPNDGPKITSESLLRTTHYLGLIGPLLRDGHLQEAKEMQTYFSSSGQAKISA